MSYSVEITPLMKRIHKVLFSNFAGMPSCISKHGQNALVEVPKSKVEEVVLCFKGYFRDVVDIRKAYLMIDDLHDFILVKPLISESPIMNCNGYLIPTIEKSLVDLVSDKEYAGTNDSIIRKEFQKAFDTNPINISRMMRYASRKGEKEQLQQRLSGINESRVEMFNAIREYLSIQPIERVWVFGSYSRMEEDENSDLDLLFTPLYPSDFSLMDHASLKLGLEELIHKEVDLVAEGSLLPFAEKTSNSDKYLIYERAS